MNIIYFKFKGGQPKDFFNTPRGNFAVGDHQNDVDGQVLLSPDCRNIMELRAQAEYLKKKIDEAVLIAEVQLPPQ